MSVSIRSVAVALGLGLLGGTSARGQIDPAKRELIQLGYNAAFEGHSPLSAYAFYYRNQPDFLHTNLTLRLAVAPVYLDSELGFRGLLGANTDLGVNLAGGGFADNYTEIRQGVFHTEESFLGHDGEGGLSLYHLFNPERQIPLYAVLRGLAHYSSYGRDDTAPNFQLPPDHTTFILRSGLRWGGREPLLFPSLAMSLSVWYEGLLRSESASYGFPGSQRRLEPDSHLFWGEAFLAYTLPELHHSFYLSVLAGTSLDTDRFSAYRLGGLLPLASEFPLSLPGYYYQEISAREFVLISGSYILPLDKDQRWNLNASAATAVVSYLPGLEQPGNWNSGLGAGVLYRTAATKIMLGYGYGIDALRTGGRGAHSVGVWMQFDLENARPLFSPPQPHLWRGLQHMLGW